MNPSLLFVASALFLWGVGEGMFFNFVPIYLRNQFVLSEPQIGFVLGLFGLSMAITHIPSGHIADRLGRRPLLITAWVLGLLSSLTMGLALHLPLFLVGLFGYGLTAFVSSPLSSYMTAGRGEWSVGTALSLTTAAFNLGMVIGPVSGGWIGEHLGMRMSFLIAAGIFVFSTVFIILIKPQPIDQHDPQAPPVGLFSNQKFIGFLFVAAFAVFAMYIAQPLTPNFLAGVRNLSLSETGWIFTAGGLGNALIALAMSRVNPRIGFPVSQGMVALFALAVWKGSSLPIFALGYFLMGGFRAARPLMLAQARELVHDSQMGLTYGTMETISAIIFIVTPPIAGFLFKLDPAIVYPIGIALIAISIVVSLIFSPRKTIHA